MSAFNDMSDWKALRAWDNRLSNRIKRRVVMPAMMWKLHGFEWLWALYLRPLFERRADNAKGDGA